MGVDGQEQPPVHKHPRAARYRIYVAVVALMLVAAISLALLYLPYSPFRERFVSYEYRVVIDTGASGEFIVICPLPADCLGTACPDVVPSVVVLGDVLVSEATTPFGEGLEIEGSGSAVITWTYNFTYRSSTQSTSDHYSNLSMLDSGYNLLESNAFVSSEGANASLSLSYTYHHVYGSVGADFMRYELSGNLTTGWNSLLVEFDWMVS